MRLSALFLAFSLLLLSSLIAIASAEPRAPRDAARGWISKPVHPWEAERNPPQQALDLPWNASSSTSAFLPGDQHWWDGFELPQVNGPVVCAIEFGGKLIIGGSFSRVGAVDADNLAAWDGTKWAPFGGGTDSEVKALHVFEGDLVIGGSFNHAGGVAARGVARWNGVQWVPLGQGLGSSYYYGASPGASAFTTFKGTLVAAGEFTRTGNFELPFMAQWNGSAWVPVVSGLDGPVYALATLGDTLYFGGRFQRAGFTWAAGAARWDGTSCSPLAGLAAPYFNNLPTVTGLIAWRGKIVAGGYFELTDSIEVGGIAAWNGSAWETMGHDTGYVGISAMIVEGEDLLVGMDGSLSRWDGNAWSQYAPGLSGQPDCLAHYGSDLVVGGAITASDETDWSLEAVGLAIHSNGTWAGLIPWTNRMRGLSGGNFTYVHELETYHDQLVAYGEFYQAGDPPRWANTRIMAAWNGATWSQFPLPNEYGWWASALLADGDSLYMAGDFYGYDEGGPKQYPVIRYDGAGWGPLDTLALSGTAMAIYDGHLYVAGQRGPDRYRAEIHRWSDSHWELVGFAVGVQQYQTIETMVVHDGKLIVGGFFEGMSNVPAKSIAAWDGSHWTDLGAGIAPGSYPPFITSMIEHRGTLVATGYTNYPIVWQWNGTSWSPLGDVYGRGTSLASAGGELYLGGQISLRHRPGTMDGIARWSGREWEPLGSGTNNEVASLELWNGSLYAAGPFTRAGSHGSFGVARWDGLKSVLGAPRLTLAAGVPNPFRASIAFRYHVAAAGPVRVSVHDVRGREIMLIEEGNRPAGDHVVSWDSRTRDGRYAVSGVYYVRVQLPGGVQRSQKAVLLHP